jgi:hypothetical protein
VTLDFILALLYSTAYYGVYMDDTIALVWSDFNYDNVFMVELGKENCIIL